ncbi:MAG: ATP-binding cassette domain-containing protein [Proteobacteria bacterium]|nr:ATP-binding cassette domain-containing protein [Pseudomonadota bacterium]
MIRLVNVDRSFDGINALDGLNLHVAKGVLLGVMGPGGCGKSTLCKVICGLIQPDSGVVFIAGTDMVQADSQTIRKIQSRTGVQFQNDALFEHITVLANVEYPLKRLTDISPRETRVRAMEYLAMVGLAGFEERIPSLLSGGQRRRVALARACVTEPDLLICDDPTAGLDPVTSRRILNMIAGIRYQVKNTVLIVSTDVMGLLSVADRVALMWEGKMIAEDTPSSFLENRRREVRRFLKDAELPTGAKKWE